MNILKHIGLSLLWGVVAVLVVAGFGALFASLGFGTLAAFLFGASVPAGILTALIYGLTRWP